MIARAAGVHVAQRTFRALLYALSYPGRAVAIPDADDAPDSIEPLSLALQLAAAALLDHEVAMWCDAPLVADVLRAGSGANICSDRALADFVVITDSLAMPSLRELKAGTAEEPECSATLLIQLPALVGGDTVVLSGPGINGEQRFAPRGVPPEFWQEWEANGHRYPLGVDVYFFDDRRVAGLPRTTRGRIE